MLLMVNVIRLLLSLLPAFFGFILLCACVVGEFVLEQHDAHLRKTFGEPKREFEKNDYGVRLLYLACAQPQLSAEATDPVTHVAAPALVLKRHVKYFEWREHRHKHKENGKKVTEWYHDKKWSDYHESSSRFKQRSQHSNPEPSISDALFSPKGGNARQ